MRIDSLKISREKTRLHTPFKTALRTAVEIDCIQVEITLHNGIKGRGEASPTYVITGDSTESIEAALNGPIREALIGSNIFHFQEALKRIQTCCVGNTSAKAAADIALFDAYCKLWNIPLFSFLGDQKPIQTCMTIGVDEPEAMAATALEKVKEGFRILKLKVGEDPKLDMARIETIIKTVPDDIKLRLDANQGWRPKQAVKLIRELQQEDFPIEFIEQPVKAQDLEGLKFVTERVDIPVMADESVFSARDALKIVSGHYADLLNIKLMKCGGISEAIKIASMAEAAGVACMIGSMIESPQSVGAAAHLAAAHPNIQYFDLDAPLWLSMEPQYLIYEGENITLPIKPGIGTVS